MSENDFLIATLMLGGIVGFIIGLRIAIHYLGEQSELNLFKKIIYFPLRVMGTMACSTFILAIIVGIGIMIYSNFVDYEHVEEHHLYPVSINREKDVYGSFVLGSGTVETTNYYYFYYESVYGLKLSKVESMNTYIVETDDRRPEIVHVVKKYDDEAYIKLNNGCVCDPIRIIIYVPKGSIIRDYKLR